MSKSKKHKNKVYERSVLKDFFTKLGYGISRPKWDDEQEKPDALLTLSRGRHKKRVAVEHTRYFHDIVERRSRLTPLAEFWEDVEGSLFRRFAQRRNLAGIGGRIRLNASQVPSKDTLALARKLAADIVKFVETCPLALWVPRDLCDSDFDGFQTLQSLVTSLRLSRWTDQAVRASRHAWECSNISTGNIGFDLRYIKTAIEKKNKKAIESYDWHGAKEKWLLIAATGEIVSKRAGDVPDDVDWTDAELATLCRNSPFSQIVFWESVSGWCKSLKPNRPVRMCRGR